MINLDDELADEYLAECGEHLATIETGLRALEKGEAEIDEQLVNRIFRAVHSIRGVGFFDLVNIGELAGRMEDALALIHSRKMVPAPDRVRVLLRATGRLRELIQNPGGSKQADIAEVLAALARLCADHKSTDTTGGADLRALLVEDDFASRLLLQTFLSRHGECHVAVNGREAVEAFRSSLERKQRYDLICMDIMMPEMDGREAVRQIRALEEAQGILPPYGAKIIMTTAVEDIKEVIHCFRELCDAYLTKPIDLARLLSLLKSYRLAR